MWQGWTKLLIGVWLVLSGIIPALTSPVNMLIVGFLVAICCFTSEKTVEIIVSGILGLWLFVIGMVNLIGSFAVNLMTPVNFLISGILLAILGIWSVLRIRKERKMSTKAA